jgi:hypothetical protein
MAKDVDWNQRTICYSRKKLKSRATAIKPALIRFGEDVAAILKRRPQSAGHCRVLPSPIWKTSCRKSASDGTLDCGYGPTTERRHERLLAVSDWRLPARPLPG